jgi:hypothetical protein
MMKLKNGKPREIRAKTIRQSYLTSDCWPVQVWGLSYCSGFGDPSAMCEFLATDECGGVRIRRMIIKGEYSKNGLPDVQT